LKIVRGEGVGSQMFHDEDCARRHELGSSDDVQDEFQPASNSTNMKDVLQWPPQCSGSGAQYRSGATCFWGSMIRIHKSEVWIRIRLCMGMVL